jgi:hypothetical protein
VDERGREQGLPIAAASALIRVGHNLLVLSDDERQMAVFDAESDEPGYLIKVMKGTTPASPGERADHKADFECMALFAPFGRFEHGAVVGLGSGSAPDRDKGTLLTLTADHRPEEPFEVVELGPLYVRLREDLNDLNIEGSAVVGDDFRLMQRGNGPKGRNARVDLELAAVQHALDQRDPIPAASVTGIEFYDLGQVRGVPLCFSDAAPIPDGRMAFIASAESSGGYVGSSIGLMESDGTVSFNEPIDHELKLEGLEATVTGEGRLQLLMVSDADDPGTPSPLMETFLEL